MTTRVLVAGLDGIPSFSDVGEDTKELPGRNVTALAVDSTGVCLALVNGHDIWRRESGRAWSMVARSDSPLQSLAGVDENIFAGGLEEAALFRVTHGSVERLTGFDRTPGREHWFAGGPPLGVRSLAVTHQRTLLAAVHVGGVPRSIDDGATWKPTMPVMLDVHEVAAHPSQPDVAVAAAAVGLCVSRDDGQSWVVVSDGLPAAFQQRSGDSEMTSLAVAALGDEVLFSVQSGPFAKRSQLWRWRSSSGETSSVQDGLPQWLEGKVDTGKLAAGDGRFAVADQSGNLWLSTEGSSGWRQIARRLPDLSAIILLECD